MKLLKKFNLPNGYQEQMYEFHSIQDRDVHMWEMIKQGWTVAHFEEKYVIYTLEYTERNIK